MRLYLAGIRATGRQIRRAPKTRQAQRRCQRRKGRCGAGFADRRCPGSRRWQNPSGSFFPVADAHGAISPPGPGEFINLPAPAATIILLDRSNERLLTTASAWHDVSVVLAHLKSLDRVHVYLLTAHGVLVPIHPLPPPDADLRVPAPTTAAELVAKVNAAARAFEGLRNVDDRDPVLRARTTGYALSMLSQRAMMAGRKNLIWVTHGFPLGVSLANGDWYDLTATVQNLAQRVAQSQMAIYTVDQSETGAGDDPAGFVYYISPLQVNILTPPDALSGPSQVEVTYNGATSAAFTAPTQSISPSFFVFNGGPYVAAAHLNGSLIGPATLYPGASTAAKPGETIVLYANGFGSTNVPVQSGSVSQSGMLSPLPVVRIGGVAATVQFAWLRLGNFSSTWSCLRRSATATNRSLRPPGQDQRTLARWSRSTIDDDGRCSKSG